MSTNYPRYCTIKIQGQAAIDVAKLRCRFDIKQHTRQTPNMATIRITNQLPATARSLVKNDSEFKTVTIDAGYEDNHGIVFSGQIVRAIYGRETPTDTLTTILCSDGFQAHNYAVVSKTHAAGSTPNDHVNTALAAMGQYGVTKGFFGPSVDLSTPSFPRAVSLFGMARQVLENIAKSKGANTSYQAGKVHMVTNKDSLPGGPIILNSKTGLVGMPTLEIGGIMARVLINPNIKVHGLVHIDQALIQGLLPGLAPDGSAAPNLYPSTAADGIYRVFQIDLSGDTRGTPWYMDIACLPPGANPTSQSIAASAGG